VLVNHKTGKYPISYISHITGIYDEYLKEWVEKNNIDISSDILFQAGLAIARKVFKMMKERKSRLGFIGGGVRGLHHFTEMVGAEACITINWRGTADKLLDINPPVVSRFYNPGPVVKFRNSFVKSWESVLNMIQELRINSR
jgi:transaldolase